jgi:thiol-disulfide isomerase/thioredoxin
MLTEKEAARQAGLCGNLERIVTPRRWAVVGGMALAVAAAVWISARLVRGPQTGRAGDSLLHEIPPGQTLTIRFFRDPAPAPDISMRDLDGRPVSPASFRGKVVLINFWATWCPPCRAEIPDLVALQARYGDWLQVIGISQDEGPVELVRRFAAAQRMNYPIVMMTPELERAFPGIAALPTSYVIDRSGRVVQRHVGMLNPVVTEQEMRALAGLRVAAAIEEVDRAQPAKLENAQATQIPGVDLASLTPEQRTRALQRLNSEPCTCGCDNTVAKCRVDDPKCGTSLPLAQRIVREITGQS